MMDSRSYGGRLSHRTPIVFSVLTQLSTNQLQHVEGLLCRSDVQLYGFDFHIQSIADV